MFRCRIVLHTLLLPVAIAPLALMAPASAEVVARGEVHEVVTETVDDWCDVEGLTVELSYVYDLRWKLTLQGREQLLHFHGIERLDETHTANGVTTRLTLNAITKDLAVSDNGDGTYTGVVLGTGNATLYGPDGKAIARNPGQVRAEFVVDYMGTPTDPDDDEILSFEQIKGSTGRSDDFCAAEVPLLS